MRLYNSLSQQIEELGPTRPIKLYTCGPTVYDFAHIGNFRTYIFEDTLRRVLTANGYEVKHVMNLTDVDDKTIARSHSNYPELEPMAALSKLTLHYEAAFLADANSLGIDLTQSKLVRATDEIEAMQEIIKKIPNKYRSEDGVYFDIGKYKEYGALVKLDQRHSHHRINNDEYDKDHVADFALWKTKTGREPSWELKLDNHAIEGRPGWHLECSAIAVKYLGEPIDIHTGGIDLKFPHHENEIAQAQSASPDKFVKIFMHAEHLLVDNSKMAKSKQNFYTLRDVEDKGYHPLSFRLLMLQSHYRSQTNFTWEAVEAAQHFLLSLYNWAELSHQPNVPQLPDSVFDEILAAVSDDLATPRALAELAKLQHQRPRQELLQQLDQLFGLELSKRSDITVAQKQLLTDREAARANKDFVESDLLRSELEKQGIMVEDAESGSRWRRATL